MQVPLQITFRDIARSDPIAAFIRDKVRKLERFRQRITGCRVTVAAPQRRRHGGGPYYVTVDVTLRRGEIVVSKGRPRRHSHRDLMVGLADAFAAARRQIAGRVGRHGG